MYTLNSLINLSKFSGCGWGRLLWSPHLGAARGLRARSAVYLALGGGQANRSQTTAAPTPRGSMTTIIIIQQPYYYYYY